MYIARALTVTLDGFYTLDDKKVSIGFVIKIMIFTKLNFYQVLFDWLDN